MEQEYVALNQCNCIAIKLRAQLYYQNERPSVTCKLSMQQARRNDYFAIYIVSK